MQARLNGTISLGECGGGSTSGTRFTKNYLEDAVDLYKTFKFVVAFENSDASGYVTEKLILSYLAGALPIYLGPKDVTNVFSSKSMINCGDFPSLADCVDEVVRVNNDNEAYLEILAEAPITGYNFRKLFSWIF